MTPYPQHIVKGGESAGGGDAGARDVEVTPAMIEAGVLELVTFGEWDQARDTAARVFRSMLSARRGSDREPGT